MGYHERMEDDSRIRQIARYEALIARDLIDLAESYPTDQGVVDMVSETCLTLANLLSTLGRDKTTIDWRTLFEVYDSRLGSILHHQPLESTSRAHQIYETASRIITSRQDTSY